MVLLVGEVDAFTYLFTIFECIGRLVEKVGTFCCDKSW